MTTKIKHLLSIEQLSRSEIEGILQRTAELKSNRGKISAQPLAGQTWALIFSKPSTRTRVSFEVGIRELGGETIYLNAADAQLGRGELIKDTARVLARMIHGAVIRTYAQSDIEEFAEFSGVPTINALTDEEHPCQILGDIFTIIEKRGQIEKTVVAYIGDGVSNTARSWLFAAGKLGFELRIASHKKYLPKKKLVERAGGRVTCTDDVATAAKGADVLYTDIWVSMGKESEEARREAELGPYWINESVVKIAKPDALVMHCLPAHRGQEIDEKTFENHAQTIFDQAENRLHVQKAILVELVK
ncbi:MAG TPA: ornithine carbamoyltransferase [Chthoniobacterales bacterium]|nr:ornithine carbamoyltransferase [Chthoniobacterales bacterium]